MMHFVVSSAVSCVTRDYSVVAFVCVLELCDFFKVSFCILSLNC